MEKDTSEQLRNLRVHLAIANRNERDFDPIIRSQVEAEISDILAGKETQQGERERPAVEVRVQDDEWLAEARRRVERVF